MEEIRKNNGQNLGIAALITAIITFVLSVIPCVGLIAIIPGIIAVVLASVGLSHAGRTNSPKGVLIAGLIIGIIASLISFSQFFIAGKLANTAGKWPHEIQNIIDDVQDNVIKDMNDEDVSIKIRNDEGETVEINATSKNKVRVLEDLEGADTTQNDTTRTKK
jgi:hypothetical protein